MHMLTEPDLSAYVPGSLMRFINFDTAVHDHVTYVRDKVAGPTYEWSVQEHLPSMGSNVGLILGVHVVACTTAPHIVSPPFIIIPVFQQVSNAPGTN